MAITQTDLDNTDLLQVDELSAEQMKQALITAYGLDGIQSTAIAIDNIVAEQQKIDGIEDNAEVNTVEIDENNQFQVAQRGTIETVTYSSDIELDLNKSNRYECVLTGNVNILNPINKVAGQGGLIYLVQDATGGRVSTWDTDWVFLDTYSEDTSPNKVNIFTYEVYNSTKIVASYAGAI